MINFVITLSKVAVDPRSDSQVNPQTTLTILWNSLSLTGQTHGNLTSICFLSVTNCLLSKIVCSSHKLEIHVSVRIFTITAEIHARSLVNFYCQYAERHMNLTFMRRVSEREREIRQFVIVKNKLMSVFNASVLLLTMNFVITFPK